MIRTPLQRKTPLQRRARLRRSRVQRRARAIAGELALPTVAMLDALCKAVTLARDQRCVRCGSEDSAHWHHAYTRRIHVTRWDLENVMILCAPCHTWWHWNEAAGFRWWVGRVGRSQERRVWKRHDSHTRPDRRAIWRELQLDLKRIEVGQSPDRSRGGLPSEVASARAIEKSPDRSASDLQLEVPSLERISQSPERSRGARARGPGARTV